MSQKINPAFDHQTVTLANNMEQLLQVKSSPVSPNQPIINLCLSSFRLKYKVIMFNAGRSRDRVQRPGSVDCNFEPPFSITYTV